MDWPNFPKQIRPVMLLVMTLISCQKTPSSSAGTSGQDGASCPASQAFTTLNTDCQIEVLRRLDALDLMRFNEVSKATLPAVKLALTVRAEAAAPDWVKKRSTVGQRLDKGRLLDSYVGSLQRFYASGAPRPTLRLFDQFCQSPSPAAPSGCEKTIGLAHQALVAISADRHLVALHLSTQRIERLPLVDRGLIAGRHRFIDVEDVVARPGQEILLLVIAFPSQQNGDVLLGHRHVIRARVAAGNVEFLDALDLGSEHRGQGRSSYAKGRMAILGDDHFVVETPVIEGFGSQISSWDLRTRSKVSSAKRSGSSTKILPLGGPFLSANSGWRWEVLNSRELGSSATLLDPTASLPAPVSGHYSISTGLSLEPGLLGFVTVRIHQVGTYIGGKPHMAPTDPRLVVLKADGQPAAVWPIPEAGQVSWTVRKANHREVVFPHSNHRQLTYLDFKTGQSVNLAIPRSHPSCTQPTLGVLQGHGVLAYQDGNVYAFFRDPDRSRNGAAKLIAEVPGNPAAGEFVDLGQGLAALTFADGTVALINGWARQE